ncbi:nuclear transport factor 2 family protein [Lentzea sp. NBRC 105346]|uniref:nuclear transport factor 2 family protein n=1 Tax=Lentzea sp. NBRC 105346 TaxID=3032205 RepID=UPI0025533B61|nr:nuclear transport factor 2 family protein [Lentzea sp. NBRC 105346]
MARNPLPALATTLSFVDRINHTDLAGLAELMHPDHRLLVMDVPPVVGRDANVEAWRGYFTAFPEYVIHPRLFVPDGNRVAVFGATTGSHLNLADDEELALGVIWLAEVSDGLVTVWQVRDDSQALRQDLGISEVDQWLNEAQPLDERSWKP